MPGRKKPRKLAPGDLKEAALDHLARYATSTARLRQLLKRRILRSSKAHEFDPASLLAELEAVIAALSRSGALNDALFAEGKARSLNRRGGSRRQIAAKLAASGVAGADSARALAQLEGEMPDSEFTAALAYAKRRRLGAFRVGADASPERRKKDLAAMARAGFALDLARRALLGKAED